MKKRSGILITVSFFYIISIFISAHMMKKKDNDQMTKFH